MNVCCHPNVGGDVGGDVGGMSEEGLKEHSPP